MPDRTVSTLAAGVNQRGVRDHNERLLLSLIQRHEALPGSDLARLAGLSAQTVSVILRRLEQDGILLRGQPQRGRVGKPSTPMQLAPDGILSVGLKIGRRSADLLLMDIRGTVRRQLATSYRYPLPETVFAFLKSGLAELTDSLPEAARGRIAGIGVAAPFDLWTWAETIGAPADEFEVWKDIDIPAEIAKFSDLAVIVQNDATAACRAEHMLGRGREFQDYAYFFVGTFIGGGVVLNNAVYDGRTGNAGAFGSLPIAQDRQLIDAASLIRLETALDEAGRPADLAALDATGWAALAPELDTWIDAAAGDLARAVLAVCAVIDFEAVLIDGAFPDTVRAALTDGVRAHLGRLDSRGLVPPGIEEGSIGANARALGAAAGPVIAQYLLAGSSTLGAQ